VEPITIVVWDHVGNVMWGVRPWEEWPARAQAQLLAEDPDAIRHAPSFAQIFEEYPVDLRQVKTEEELAATIGEADFLVIHKERVPPEVLRQGVRLRLIQHLGLDYRGVPVETAREMGVPVAATPLINYLVVAEHSWALILNHLKQLPAQRAHMQQRGYKESWGTFPNLKPVRDMTLGLLGFGEIARPMARIAQAFAMPTIYWDIVRFPELEERYGVHYVEWDEIFRRADVLSVHLALNERTEGVIGAREIGLMKPTALFVNTARGKLVDQAALTIALRERRLGGAGLDVFAVEPLPPDDPLHDLHERLGYNVTLTPHSAWQSHWTHIRDSQGIWLNVLRMLRGEPVQHLV
jgi:phosphoglycerate dehydrogenase-like enzyme